MNTVPLPDGEYPAFIIDVDDGRDDDGHRLTHLELTVLTGEHKGAVVAVTARGLEGDFVALIGMPATIRVVGGVPAVTID